MRERVREWRRNRRRQPGLNTPADAEAFAKRLKDLRDEPTMESPAVPAPQPEPAVEPEPTPDIHGALCPDCVKPVKLRKDGRVAAHKGCGGGNREPLPLDDCPVCAVELPIFAEVWHSAAHMNLTWKPEPVDGAVVELAEVAT